MNVQHTLGHVDCPACLDARRTAIMQNSELSGDLEFREASRIWLEAQFFSEGRPRYVAPRTLKDDAQYRDALNRFFGPLRLSQIHIGNIAAYQELRTAGKLGVPEEAVLARCARWHRCTVEKLLAVDAWRLQAEQMIARSRRGVRTVKVNQELSLLMRILRRAGLWTGELAECYQPLAIEYPDIPRALTPEEQTKFLETAASCEDWRTVYWYASLALESTLTNCEQRGLRLGDINLYQQVLMVRAASAKNRFRVRTIPLTPNAQWAVERLMERAKFLGAAGPDDYVFPFCERRHTYNPHRSMTVSGLKKPWDEVRRAAGVPWFRVHDLRHTAITRMAEAGVPIAVIMSIAGHVSQRMTQHYTQISDTAKRRAMLAAFGAKRMPVRSAPPLGMVAAGNR